MNTGLLLSVPHICLALAGCAFINSTPAKDTPTDIPATGESGTIQIDPSAAPPPGTARTADQFDTTSDEQKSRAQNTPDGAERALGTTIASLGTPSEAGFWLKTPLTDTTGPGRVEYPKNGTSVQVTLVPLDGPATAGSQLSLAAFRVIGAPLTSLAEVQVFLAQED